MLKLPNYLKQSIPIYLTFVVFIVLSALLWAEIKLLNFIQPACYVKGQCLSSQIYATDVIVGITIYLKTSVDFAIFIGNLMRVYPTVRGRIAIEIGTAFGNALGTIIVLAIWSFFKEIRILLAIMITIAALVLLKLAEEGLEHISVDGHGSSTRLISASTHLRHFLHAINSKTNIVLSKIMPNLSMKPNGGLGFAGLFATSFTVPFILGLDDFAGYVPVFNIVNVFGFSVGVIMGHMILNLCLFLSPKVTIRVVKNSYVAFLGSLAFVTLSIWGIFEVFKLLFAGGH